MAQVEGVEAEQPVRLGSPRLEVGLDVGRRVHAAQPHVGEVPLEHPAQLGPVEEVEVEGVLEVGRLVRGEHARHTVVAEDARELGDVRLGRGEVLDEMRRAHAVEAGLPQAEVQRVGASDAQPPGPVARRGRPHGVGGVVDAHHLAVVGQEAGRLEPLAAPHVEHPAGPDPVEDGAIARLVQREQGVRRDTLLGTLPRQAGPGARRHGRSLRVPRRGGAACLHYPATFWSPVHDHLPHRHRPPGPARRHASGAAGKLGRAGTARTAGATGAAAARREPVVDRLGGRSGRLRLRALPRRAPRRGHARHQDLPLPRPAPLPEPGRVHVEPDRGPRHGHTRVHRLPPPDGSLLRRLPSPRRPRLGGPAPVARVHPLRRRTGRPLRVAHPRAARARPGRGRPDVHAVAVLLAVRGAHLGHPVALGRPPLHAGPDHRRPAPGRLARAGPLRLRRGAGQRHQRELHHLRRRRPPPLDPLCRRHPARVHLAARARHRRAHRRPHPRGVPVVDRRPRGGGRLRRQRPQVHRDRPFHLRHVQPGRHHPRARLLVLLRERPPRRVDQRGDPLHPEHQPARHLLRGAGRGRRGRRLRPLARARRTSSSSSSSAWCSRSGPFPSPTPPASEAG